MHEIETRWKEIKESVRTERELSDVAYNTWIAPLKFYKVENNVAIISIPSDRTHSLDYISKKFKFEIWKTSAFWRRKFKIHKRVTA